MSGWGSEGLVTAEEVRAWYQSRGIPVSPKQLSRRHVDGWNKAHPNRPYVVGSFVHGTSNGYFNHDCRCEPCTSAGSAKSLAMYHEHRSPDARTYRGRPS